GDAGRGVRDRSSKGGLAGRGRAARRGAPSTSGSDVKGCPGWHAVSTTGGGCLVRFAKRRTLAAALAVAFGSLLAVGPAFIGAAAAAGPDTTYLVLAPYGNSTAKASEKVGAAGGTIVANYSQIGVLVVRSTNPDFASAASGSGVEAVASTTGLGTPLAEDETLGTVDSDAV